MKPEHLRVLGIESSCDETAAAVVDGTGRVLADQVASQIDAHGPYGGVVPELAAREHLRAIGPVVEQALAVLPGGLGDLHGIAVTQGPGLSGALLVGTQMAKTLSWATGLPLVGVDHLTAHLLSPFLHYEALPKRTDAPKPGPSVTEAPQVPLEFPYVALLISGGHTALYEVQSPSDIALLSQTRDDAVGEAYDKSAKLLGMGYPGGPRVDKLAALGDPAAIPFPFPMPGRDNLEFSFSGLKTAVAHHVNKHGAPDTESQRADLCASFQSVVVRNLTQKSLAACRLHSIPRLVITGGVAANRGLRAHAEKQCAAVGVNLHIPPFRACTDNAAMVAFAGTHRLLAREDDGIQWTHYTRPPNRRRGKFPARN